MCDLTVFENNLLIHSVWILFKHLDHFAKFFIFLSDQSATQRSDDKLSHLVRMKNSFFPPSPKSTRYEYLDRRCSTVPGPCIRDMILFDDVGYSTITCSPGLNSLCLALLLY